MTITNQLNMNYRITILTLSIFFCSLGIQASFSNSSLLIKGYVTEKGKKSGQAEVKAFEGNELVWSTLTNPDGSFEFIIPENK